MRCPILRSGTVAATVQRLRSSLVLGFGCQVSGVRETRS
ncbi:hypothetical protein D1AOALGA4SA_5056 [Olavius algarvensis Delta 1 endosymbiont]|nr:hypothetical protein D1AOALGA4SA_5056 [Olavius algarvensis Delta 1 endosymbiont]